MQQIGLIVQQRKDEMARRAPSPDSLQRTDKNDQLTEFCKVYTPAYQHEICNDPAACFFGDYPTLEQLRTAYGRNAAIVWVLPQLHNLSEYCGCKGKLEGDRLEDCSYTISTEFSFLKVSEVMLFFHRFKSGRYGRFYGNVDPLIITESLRTFCKERLQAYDDEKERERKLREEEYRKTAISYEEWLKLKAKSCT